MYEMLTDWPSLAWCLAGVPPPSQSALPGLQAFNIASYLVKGDVPIRVMNGIITASKQFPGR